MLEEPGYHRIGESVLPARVDELERAALTVELRRRLNVLDQLRDLLNEEQSEQARIQREIDQRLGSLRGDIDRLTSEITRLESRLDRLAFSRQFVSDEELDEEVDSARADEAAWWAEWRHRQSERRDARLPKTRNAMPDDITIRRLYRALARLVHPDYAMDQAEKARREEIMRQANEAKEDRDASRLRHLFSIWSAMDERVPNDIVAMRSRIAQASVEQRELRRQLNTVRQSDMGRLLRLDDRALRRHLRQEESRLRRELALHRLRRRRVLRTLEDRRQQLSPSPGDA
jgi:hypothetical protein